MDGSQLGPATMRTSEKQPTLTRTRNQSWHPIDTGGIQKTESGALDTQEEDFT